MRMQPAISALCRHLTPAIPTTPLSSYPHHCHHAVVILRALGIRKSWGDPTNPLSTNGGGAGAEKADGVGLGLPYHQVVKGIVGILA